MGKYKMDRYGLKKKVRIKSKEKFVAKKSVKIGFACMRNEEQSVLGWIKQADYFCEELHIILDPDTTDKTLELIKGQPIDVTVSYQDKSLGDSDDGGLGPKHELTMHIEQNNFVKKHIKVGEWFMSLDADERFHPHDYYRISNEIQFAKLHDFDQLMHRRLLEPLNIDLGQLKYVSGVFYYDPNAKKNDKIVESMFTVKWPDWSRPTRFQKKTQYWHHSHKPHGGFLGRFYPFVSAFPLWHFHKLKYGEIMPTSERDMMSSTARLLDDNNDMIPLIPMTHQISDWRDLSMLEFGRYGDIKYPAILSTIKNDGVQYSKGLSKRIHETNNRMEKNKRKWVNDNQELLKNNKL